MEPHSKNLSRGEKQALGALKRNPHLMIKQADKGGATVILNTKDYVAEAERQLSNRAHYRPTDSDCTAEFSLR